VYLPLMIGNSCKLSLALHWDESLTVGSRYP
jgi:hypothetical protein